MTLLAPWPRLDRILAIRLDAMGDLLMTTPALRAIRAANPRARLTLLTSPGAGGTARLISEVNEVIEFDAPWMKATEPRLDAASDRAMIHRLAQGAFDAAMIFTVNSQSPLPAALMCHLADIPRRLAHCRENPYQLLTDWVPEPEPDQPDRHEVQRQMELVAAVGMRPEDDHLSIRVPPEASRQVRALQQELGIVPGRPWLAVHPGASAPSRRYPPDRFGAVVRDLHAITGWPVVYTGSSTEGELIERVRTASGGIGRSVAGRLDVAELAAFLACAPLLISNNTGPVHLAAAVGTPVVDVYALTNIQHTPWRVPARVVSFDVPCKGCRKSSCPLGHHLCLTGVEPRQVVAAALDLAAEIGLLSDPRPVARQGPRAAPVQANVDRSGPRAARGVPVGVARPFVTAGDPGRMQ